MADGVEHLPAGAVELSGGVLRVTWTPGVLIDEAAARSMIKRAVELSGGDKLPALVEMRGVRGITAEAGTLFARDWPSSRTAIVGDSPVDEVIATFYTSRHRPARPIRFFTSLPEAGKWLAGPEEGSTEPASGRTHS